MKYRGFTLIEVLIVVIVLGILATLMMPQISSMVERARAGEAYNVLGAIRTGLMAYYIDNGTSFPGTAITNNIGNMETVLGDLADETKSLFTYSWSAGNANSITVTAVRYGGYRCIAAGAKTATVAMNIHSTGAAESNITWN